MEKQEGTNLFVKFLPAEIDDVALYYLFSPFGLIVSSKVGFIVDIPASRPCYFNTIAGYGGP